MNLIKNVYPERRMVLKERLPLALPLCISIEPTNLCNFKCVMCYHGNNEYAEGAKPLKNMDMSCFNKVISDIKDWLKTLEGAKVKLIKLYSLGEPLIHPEICNMVSLIKQADLCEQIEITTNGSLLTKEIAEKLVDYGLDILRISIYSVDDKRNEYITKSKIKPEEIEEKVRYIREYRDKKKKVKPHIIVKMIDTYTEENQKFLELYQNIGDSIGIDELFHLNSGENDVFENMYEDKAEHAFEKSMETNIYKYRKVCRYPFTHLTVRCDGGVVLCCTDWLKELLIGNVNCNSLKEIWESKTLYNLRCSMLRDRGININVCKDCELPYRDLPEDNIDDFPIEKLTYNNEI